MTASLGWLATGGAVLLIPGRRGFRRPGPPDRPVPGSAPVAAAPRRRAGPGRAGPAGAASVAAGVAAAVLAGSRLGPPAGVLVALATFAGLRRLSRRRPPTVADRSLALALDLAAAALRSGRPLADALDLAAPAGRADVAAELLQVAGLSRLGADAATAWSSVPRDGPLGPLATAAVRSAASGSRLAAAFERVASDIRAERVASAAGRAHRAGVLAMAPLAGCYLPSFVCLGIVPVVVGIAATAFHGLT